MSVCFAYYLLLYACIRVLLLFSFRRQKSGAPHVSQISLSISLSVRALIPGYHQRFTLALRYLGQGPVWHFNFPLSDEVMNVPSILCICQ